MLAEGIHSAQTSRGSSERLAVVDIHAMISAIDDLIAEQTAMT